jgi:hypothetical protein
VAYGPYSGHCQRRQQGVPPAAKPATLPQALAAYGQGRVCRPTGPPPHRRHRQRGQQRVSRDRAPPARLTYPASGPRLVHHAGDDTGVTIWRRFSPAVTPTRLTYSTPQRRLLHHRDGYTYAPRARAAFLTPHCLPGVAKTKEETRKAAQAKEEKRERRENRKAAQAKRGEEGTKRERKGRLSKRGEEGTNEKRMERPRKRNKGRANEERTESWSWVSWCPRKLPG